MSNFEQTGDGAVQTTVEDVLLWDRNFQSGTVLGRQGLEWMQTPGVLNSGKPLTYAFGLMVEQYRGLAVVQHGGSWAGYRAQYMRFPAQKFSVVCLCNAANANPGARARKVADVFLGALMKEADTPASGDPAPKPQASEASPPVALSTEQQREFVGAFYSEEADVTYTIFERDGRLQVRIGRWTEMPIEPIARDTFRFRFGQLIFLREAGRIGSFTVQAGRVRNIRFVKK
jgi:hypothetical protein